MISCMVFQYDDAIDVYWSKCVVWCRWLGLVRVVCDKIEKRREEKRREESKHGMAWHGIGMAWYGMVWVPINK